MKNILFFSFSVLNIDIHEVDIGTDQEAGREVILEVVPEVVQEVVQDQIEEVKTSGIVVVEGYVYICTK